MRTLARLLPLLLLVPLAACGDEDVASGARVRLLSSAADGAHEGELKLQAVDDEHGQVYAAHRLRADDPDLYVAPGAPPGKYRVYTTAGWGMLWTGTKGSAAPILSDGRQPATVVRIGKPRSIYVAAADPSLPSAPVGLAWAGQWKLAAGGAAEPFHAAAVEVVDQGEGIIAVRFPVEAWRLGHVLRLSGRMSDGSATQLLSYAVRDEVFADLPRLALVHPAAPAPLTVHLVPPPGQAAVPDGTPVTVTLQDVPLEAVYTAESFRGRAVFDAIAALGHAIRVALPDSGERCAFVLDADTWRTRQALHVVAQPTQVGQAASVVVVGPRLVEARVAFADGSAYGRVPLEHMEIPAQPPGASAAGGSGRHRTRLLTQPGLQAWWLRSADGRWFHSVQDIPVPPAEAAVTIVGAGAGKACYVRGMLRGGGFGYRVVFRQLREAHRRDGQILLPERVMSGDGFEAAASPQGEYTAELPPGRYEIRVFTPIGGGGRPRTMALPPGAEVHLNLPGR